MIVSIIFLIFGSIRMSVSEITDSEFNVTLSLIKHLNAKNCIVISDIIDISSLNQIRYLTFSQNIYTTHKNSQELGKYMTSKLAKNQDIDEIKFPDSLPHKVIIVWKTTIDQINDIMSHVSHFAQILQ